MPPPRHIAQNLARLDRRAHAVRLTTVAGLAAVLVKADGTPNIRAIKREFDARLAQTGDTAYRIGTAAIRDYLEQAAADPTATDDARGIVQTLCPGEYIAATLMDDYQRLEDGYNEQDFDINRGRRMYHQSRVKLREEMLGLQARLGLIGGAPEAGEADITIDLVGGNHA